MMTRGVCEVDGGWEGVGGLEGRTMAERGSAIG
jgi:hypothetical protein